MAGLDERLKVALLPSGPNQAPQRSAVISLNANSTTAPPTAAALKRAGRMHCQPALSLSLSEEQNLEACDTLCHSLASKAKPGFNNSLND